MEVGTLSLHPMSLGQGQTWTCHPSVCNRRNTGDSSLNPSVLSSPCNHNTFIWKARGDFQLIVIKESDVAKIVLIPQVENKIPTFHNFLLYYNVSMRHFEHSCEKVPRSIWPRLSVLTPINSLWQQVLCLNLP